MKAIDIKKMTDKQFEMYLRLLIKIRNKFQEGSLISDDDWNEYKIDYLKVIGEVEFKSDRLNKIEETKKNLLREFVFFESRKPVHKKEIMENLL